MVILVMVQQALLVLEMGLEILLILEFMHQQVLQVAVRHILYLLIDLLQILEAVMVLKVQQLVVLQC